MNLNDLKPAWSQLKLSYSLERIDHQEILQIIEPKEELAGNTVRRFLANSVLFLILMICCQGG